MNCEQAIALISSRIDGELSPADAAALDDHLAECPACAATAEAFELQDADMRHAFDDRRHHAGTVAERVAERLPHHAAPRGGWKRLRRRARPYLFGAVLAAALVGLAWLLGVHSNPPVTPPSVSNAAEPLDQLTARPKPPVPQPQQLAVGQTVTTKPGERRRVALPDGSVVYVNQGTTVTLDKDRHLTLSTGEVFVEARSMSLGEGIGPFVVQAPRREVTAVGTKFDVQATPAQTSVLVAQGYVLASGHDGVIPAGYEMSADGSVTDAPRASYLLDWTRDLMAEADTPLVPASEYGGGALVAVDPYGQQAKLSLRKYHVDVHIEDGFARTTIDQTYFNHANWRLEGTFYFPLPPDASLSRLAMYVDGKRMEGGMVERDFGRQVYEKIVATQRDPALLEWVDGSTFKMRVFPLEARKEKRIILSYTQRLPADYGRMTYRFPAGHSLEVVRDWSFHAAVTGGAGLSAESPSHPEMKIERAGADLILDAADHNVAVNRDVVLHLTDDRAPLAPGGRGVGGEGAADVARFSGAEADGNPYLMLRYRPALEARAEKSLEPRTWVILFESSGDRDPLLARTQIEVVRALLNNAEHSDTFAILAAGTNVHAFAPEAKPVTPENVAAGLAFLDKSHLIGALDLGKALTEAEPFLKAAKDAYLIHLGTGVAAMGEKRDDVLAKRLPAGAHYVGVGVGRRWNRAFMKAAAERTGGYFTQINPDEPVSWRGFELHAALTAPRLLDVAVTDNAGRRWLTCANSLTAGEEVCAAVRLEGDHPRPPQTVRVTGSLDGKPFERVVPVRDVADRAGYIPRTWAKLEIDRLLAEDAAKNREKVVELSKATYVMTPYTSLLVLENEQMYRENKVDRGRKDHWAMYDCPETIKVVYEPDENSPIDPSHPADQKPTEQQVLQTIQVRIPPHCIRWPNPANGPGGPVVTALHLYGEAVAAPGLGFGSMGRLGVGRGDADLKTDAIGVDGEFGDRGTEILAPVGFPTAEGLPAAIPAPPPISDGFPDPMPSPKPARPRGRNRPVEWRAWSEGRRASDESPVFIMDGAARSLPFTPTSGQELSAYLWNAETGKKVTQMAGDGTGAPLGNVLFREVPDPLSPEPMLAFPGSDGVRVVQLLRESAGDRPIEFGVNVNGRWVSSTVTRTETNPRQPPRPRFVRFADAIDRLLGSGGEPRLYTRPSFSGDERVFTDLASYAPGMNTSRADVGAVLEDEAAPRLSDVSGGIDPAARKLIDRARSAGWRKMTVKGKDGKTALVVTFDGAGRYAYQRTLASGLREQVVCDGRTLLHLYPDLGIGARRTVSRFHRADFAGIAPWLVLPAEDLAHGTEISAADDHTVAVSPRGASAAKGDDGQPAAYVRLLMAFADDGRLTERRLVLMPKGETLLRDTYAADGTVKRLDGEDKELSSVRFELGAAAAPDLTPDTSALVVLPLPFRSREVVYQKYGFNPGQPLTVGENACHAYLNEDDALELFAAEFAAQNGANARIIYESCFAGDTARVPGFHVLLASCGDRTPRSPQLQALRSDPKRERDPLLLYLTLLNLPENLRWQPYTGLDLMGGFCKDHPFLGPLAAFEDQWLVWRTWGEVDAMKAGDGWLRERQRRGLEFVRSHKGTALAWALLVRLDEDTLRSDTRFHAELADAYGLFADHPALGYAARYERARALLHADKRGEARAQYREMFGRAIKAGVLPAVDASFRRALQGNEAEADLWTDDMRQTAADFCKNQRRPAAVALAWQCWQLGDQPLASNLLAAALDGIDDHDERVLTTLAAVGFLYQTSQHAGADARLRPLLEDKDLSGLPALWRMAGRIAESRGQAARSVECLERALALEYRDLPEVINLEQVRRDYRRLLEHYQSLASAVTALKIDPPRDLLARTVRAADCWRALDRDEAGKPCDEAAAILRALGANDLAWEYQTTPIANRPNESGPWLGLAESLQREGDFALADRAFVAAFEAEPTNPQILWDRAQALRQAGQQAEARKLMRQVADTDWKQPRFNWVRSQAKWQLDGK